MCPHCSAEVASGFRFCPHCGGRQPEVSAELPPVPPPAPRKTGGERRIVTVVFADVAGFTRMSEQLDPEVVTALMNRLFERIASVVVRWGGTVDKYIGDAVMALFGAPVAQEGDAERAILAAREMLEVAPEVARELAAELGPLPPLGLHVGIASGLVVAGTVGSGAGGGYTVMGDAVNLAARLVDLAPGGEIFASGTTLRLAGPRVRSEAVQTVRVKGKREPVDVHRIVGVDPEGSDARGVALFAAPLVGRSEERQRLAAALSALADGRGAVVALVGVAGVGKTRLLGDVLSGGIRPTVGRCLSWGNTVPYFPWSRIVVPLREELAAAGAAIAADPALAEMASGSFRAGSPADAAARRQEAFRAIRELLVASAAERPRVLVLEDAQWADPSSLDLLAELLPLAAEAPLAFVLVYRGGEGFAVEARLSAVAHTRIEISPLPPGSAFELVAAATAEVAGLDDETRRRVALRSEGVPLFVDEILRGWLEEGWISRGDGGRLVFQGARGAAPIPTTLHALLASRIDRLQPAERERLELASVFGRDFSARVVDELLGRVPEPSAWHVLSASGEIQEAGPGRFRFAHALLQEVVYETMLRGRRQELHLRIAEAILADEAVRERNLHSLAFHLERAGRPEEAGSWWLEAARRAVAIWSNAEAVGLFDKAIAASAGSAADRIRIERAELLGTLGCPDDAAAALEAVAAGAAARGDVAILAEALARRAYTAYQQGNGAGILEFATRALEAARRSGERGLVALSLRQLGIAHEFGTRFSEAERAYRELLEVEADAPTFLSARTYNSLGEMARASGRFAEAIGWYELHREGMERLKPGVVLPSYLANCGAARLGLGEAEPAKRLLDLAIEHRLRTGHVSFLSEAYVFRSRARLALADGPGAVEDARNAWLLAVRNREAEMKGLSLRLLSELALAGHEVVVPDAPAGAVACAEESLRILEEAGKRGEAERSRAVLGLALSAAERNPEARRVLRTAAFRLADLGLAAEAAECRKAAGPEGASDAVPIIERSGRAGAPPEEETT